MSENDSRSPSRVPGRVLRNSLGSRSRGLRDAAEERGGGDHRGRALERMPEQRWGAAATPGCPSGCGGAARPASSPLLTDDCRLTRGLLAASLRWGPRRSQREPTGVFQHPASSFSPARASGISPLSHPAHWRLPQVPCRSHGCLAMVERGTLGRDPTDLQHIRHQGCRESGASGDPLDGAAALAPQVDPRHFPQANRGARLRWNASAHPDIRPSVQRLVRPGLA